jgi:hypothetical protein
LNLSIEELRELAGVSDDNCYLSLPRQIAYLNLETCVADITASIIDANADIITYLRDAYSDGNPHKKNAVVLEYLADGRSVRIAEPVPNQELADIRTYNNMYLNEFHRKELKRKGYGDIVRLDISPVLSRITQAALETKNRKLIRRYCGSIYVSQEEEVNGEKVVVRKLYTFSKKDMKFVNRENKDDILSLDEVIELAANHQAQMTALFYYQHIHTGTLPIVSRSVFWEGDYNREDEKIRNLAQTGFENCMKQGIKPLFTLIADFDGNDWKYLSIDRREAQEVVEEELKRRGIVVDERTDIEELTKMVGEIIIMNYERSGKET